MDVAKLSTDLSMYDLQSAVGIQMLSNNLNVAKEQGQEFVEMIDKAALERSVNPDIGANFDMQV